MPSYLKLQSRGIAKRLATQPDYPNAMHWMQQAAQQSGPLAADQQIWANAAWQVGDWYQAGLGEPKNPALATPWWQCSARLGNTNASYRLGLVCQEQREGKLVSDASIGSSKPPSGIIPKLS